MHAAERREIRVGAIAALVLGLGLALVLVTNRAAQKTDAGVYHLTADFNRADGISIGSPVRLAGLDVATVSHMTVDGRGRALLTFRFENLVPLPDDTAAVIETDGLFGSKYVELRPGGSERTFKSGSRISFTQDSVILEDLVALIVQRAKGTDPAPPAVHEAAPEPKAEAPKAE